MPSYVRSPIAPASRRLTFGPITQEVHLARTSLRRRKAMQVRLADGLAGRGPLASGNPIWRRGPTEYSLQSPSPWQCVSVVVFTYKSVSQRVRTVRTRMVCYNVMDPIGFVISTVQLNEF